MTTSIEKFKLHCKIAVSFYKHRGDVAAISDDLNIDSTFIKKATDKIRTKMKRDVAYQLAINIMESIYMGYHQRTAHLNECLLQLRSAEEADVSICCGAMVKEKEEGNAKVFYCLKCNRKANIHHVHKAQIYRLIQDFCKELREEDARLLEFADKMGFTTRDEVPVNIYRQNIVAVVNEKSPKYEMTDADNVLLKDIDEMSPIERQRMRRRLEKAILEGEVVEEKGEPVKKIVKKAAKKITKKTVKKTKRKE